MAPLVCALLLPMALNCKISRLVRFLVVFEVFLLFYRWLSPGSTNFDEHEQLAEAIVHSHHLYIQQVSPWMEHFNVGGHSYFVQPPGPAFALVPLVWLFNGANQVIFCVVLGALGVALTSLLSDHDWAWLVALLGFGTVYTYEAVSGDSWAIPLVGSVPLSLLALLSLDRGGRCGFFAGLASLFRYDLLLAWPGYARLMSRVPGWFLLGILPAAILSLWFNWARIGTPFATGFAIYAQSDPQAHGEFPFQIKYLSHNLWHCFLDMPSIRSRWPYLYPLGWGQGLLLTSPAFLIALRGGGDRNFRCVLWLMAVAASIPCLTVYAWGYWQFGYRYAIQLYPFLLGLMALRADKHRLDWLDKLLIIVSVILVQLSTLAIHQYGLSMG